MAQVSVILPARDRAGVIGRQLEALARQDLDEPFEVIVADNGSTDATAAVARGFADRFARLVVVDASDAVGGAGARNVAARHATGEILAFCDSDDVAQPNWLRRLVEPFGGRQSGGILVAGRLLPLDPDEPVPPPEEWGSARARPRVLGFLPFADTASLAVAADDLRRLQGFDPSFARCSDVEFSWRAQLEGLELLLAPDSVMVKLRPTGTRARWRQSYDWGRYHAQLYRRFRTSGMERRPSGEVLRRYGKLVARTALCFRPRERQILVTASGEAAGHIAGSWRSRVLYL